MLVVIEIKGTGWDAIPADRVMRNLRRHLRQLQADLDTAIEDMEAGQWGVPMFLVKLFGLSGPARFPCL
jgi:hypothetical protein